MVWLVTPDLDESPILQGKRRERPFLHPYLDIWPLTYQRFLIISTSHRRLVCKLMCVCVISSVSQRNWGGELCGLSHQRNSKASFYPILREVSFDSLSDVKSVVCSIINSVQTVTLAVLTCSVQRKRNVNCRFGVFRSTAAMLEASAAAAPPPGWEQTVKKQAHWAVTETVHWASFVLFSNLLTKLY